MNTTSEKVDKLIPALIAARKEIHAIGKDASGRFKYASLPAIINIVMPALLKHGLFLTQNEVWIGNEVLVLATEIFEISGQFIRSTTRVNDLRFVDNKATMSNIQNHGSNLTYLKRYAINNMLCLEIQEDDPDGPAAPYVYAPKNDKTITENQVKLLQSKIKDRPKIEEFIVNKLGIDDIKMIPMNKFNEILEWVSKQP